MKTQLYKKLLELLNLKKEKSYRILDFGCGRGELLDGISKCVGAKSHLVGIDAMKKSIAIAKAKHPGIDFQHDKFTDTLNFPDEYFDIIISVDTLECITQKEALLNEIWRILKSNGTVLCAHWDWDTQVYYSEHKHVIRNFVHTFTDWKQEWMDACDGMMGRKLWSLFQRTKRFRGTIEICCFIETTFEKGNYGYERLQDLGHLVKRNEIKQDEYDLIKKEMEELHKRGEYFYSLNSYIYHGEKLVI